MNKTLSLKAKLAARIQTASSVVINKEITKEEASGKLALQKVVSVDGVVYEEVLAPVSLIVPDQRDRNQSDRRDHSSKEEENRKDIRRASDLIAESTSVELRELQPISVPFNPSSITAPMKVSKRVVQVKNREFIPVLCTATGITIELVIPTIPNMAMEYVSPLAIYSNVKGLLSQGSAYLEKLDTTVLAGIWLTSYKHYGLLDHLDKLNATALNAIIRTAGKTNILDSLELINYINNKNSLRLPAFSLDYSAHREATSFGPALQNYTKLLRSILFPTITVKLSTEEVEEDKVQRIQRKKATTAEREAKDHFIANRREGKKLISALYENRQVPAMLLNKLKPLFVGELLQQIQQATRDKIVAKLNTFNSTEAKRLAVIISVSFPIHSVEDDLDRAIPSPSVSVNGKKLSLKEKLAMRLAGSNPSEGKHQEPSIEIPSLKEQVLEELSDNITPEDAQAEMLACARRIGLMDDSEEELEDDDLESEEQDNLTGGSEF